MQQRTTPLPPVVLGIEGSDAAVDATGKTVKVGTVISWEPVNTALTAATIALPAQSPVAVSRQPQVSAPASGNRVAVGIDPTPDNDLVVVADVVGPHDPAILGHAQCPVLLAR